MLKAYLIDDVTLRQFKGSDQWGKHNTPTDVTVKARVDYKERRLVNANNEVVVSMAKVMMEPRTVITSGFATRVANTISHLDKITVDGVDRNIIRIAKANDFRTRHLEVYIA